VYDRERERREAIVFLALLLLTMALITVGVIYVSGHFYAMPLE
jgi:hypothetical protein